MKPLLTSLLSLSLLATCPVYAEQQTPPTGQLIANISNQPPIEGPAQYFTGKATINPLYNLTDPSRSVAYVTFEPSARSAWHTHPKGQLLIVTEGTGLTQEWGSKIHTIKEGDVIWCPPGIKHWHGAAPNSAMTHISIVEAVNGKNVKWLEKVTDQQYQTP